MARKRNRILEQPRFIISYETNRQHPAGKDKNLQLICNCVEQGTVTLIRDGSVIHSIKKSIILLLPKKKLRHNGYLCAQVNGLRSVR